MTLKDGALGPSAGLAADPEPIKWERRLDLASKPRRTPEGAMQALRPKKRRLESSSRRRHSECELLHRKVEWPGRR